MNNYDTICAISTALGKSAINIIRLSGEDSIEIASKIISGVDIRKKEGGTITHAYVKDGENYIDEILVSVFRAPKSYTGENLVEINTHGGAYVTEKVFDMLISLGARVALPGEFTKRAFINNKMDLTSAEAVMDIVNANTRKSLDLANKALHKDIYNLVHELRENIMDILLQIEVNIDYPEYEDEIEISHEKVKHDTNILINKISDLIDKAEVMRVYKEGIKTVILGKPNVGKSSLLNALLNQNKAIVTNISGTTRDIVEGEINIGGIVLHLLDTAGVRNTDNPIERIGIKKTLEVLEEAELVLLVLDTSSPLDSEDYSLLEMTKDKKRIIIGNKIDLNGRLDIVDIVNVSSITKAGVDELKKKIIQLFIALDMDKETEVSISSTRHISLLKEALASLKEAYESEKEGLYLDMIEIDFKKAYTSLGLITGEEATSDIVDELFKKFCLGK